MILIWFEIICYRFWFDFKSKNFDLPQLWVLTTIFVCVAANNRADLAFKTTIVEDTYLTLIGFLSKVEANNSLIFLPLQTNEKKSCWVSVPVHIYNSLVGSLFDLELHTYAHAASLSPVIAQLTKINTDMRQRAVNYLIKQ